eukprot:366181-Chlamydomonas_euryale.AAC.1
MIFAALHRRCSLRHCTSGAFAALHQRCLCGTAPATPLQHCTGGASRHCARGMTAAVVRRPKPGQQQRTSHPWVTAGGNRRPSLTRWKPRRSLHRRPVGSPPSPLHWRPPSGSSSCCRRWDRRQT